MNTPENQKTPERALEHARNAHANIQHVIPFIDTKSGILLTYSFAALVGPFWVINSVCGNECFKKENIAAAWDAHPWAFAGTALLLGCILISWAGCVYCCLHSVSPQSPSAAHGSGPTVLFPHYSEDDLGSVRKKLKSLDDGWTIKEILDEYQNQLLQLGIISCRKIKWHRRACACFMWQLVVPGVIHSVVILVGRIKKRRPKR